MSAQNTNNAATHAEDGIRDSVASRGLGDVYKRQVYLCAVPSVS